MRHDINHEVIKPAVGDEWDPLTGDFVEGVGSLIAVIEDDSMATVDHIANA